MTDFVQLDDAKRWLDISSSDTSMDDVLAALITAASDAAIKVMNRDPSRKKRSAMLDGYGGELLPSPWYPITAVDRVALLQPDGITLLELEASQYTFDEHQIILRGGRRFPNEKRSVAVSLTAGLSEIPPVIQIATKYIIKAMWTARTTDMNTTGENFAGVSSASFWSTGPGNVPPAARELLMAYYNPVGL